MIPKRNPVISTRRSGASVSGVAGLHCPRAKVFIGVSHGWAFLISAIATDVHPVLYTPHARREHRWHKKGRRKTNGVNKEYVPIRLCYLLLSVNFCQFRKETGRSHRLGLPPSLYMSQKRPQIDSVLSKLYWELSPPFILNTKFACHPLLKINS